MLENVYEIVDSQLIKFRKQKKVTYEQRMENFRAQHGHYIDEMLSYIAASADKTSGAKEVSEAFVDSLFKHFAWHGKVRGIKNSDTALFMIFYVFPAILLTENADAKLLCDELLAEFKLKFGNPDMSYTNFKEIHESFSEKIFGLF